MKPERSLFPEAADTDALRVFLLGSVPFDAALALQRALVYQVGSERRSAALVLCEHPPLITVGRQGSPGHLRHTPEELNARRCPVRWVNRGGGCLLHLPGQLAVYPIVALDRHGLGVGSYLERLHQVVLDVLADFGVRGQARPGHPGVWVGARLIAGIGVAVCDWVSYFGVALNLNPDLAPFRLVQNGPPGDGPMTSLERERRGPLRPSLVREAVVNHFAAAFRYGRTSLFFDHPLLGRKPLLGRLTACP
jgi:lipoyl(octanoyl) transferase